MSRALSNFYFTKELDENRFYAVGGANSDVTGVVTAVLDGRGNPKIGVDYQTNVWDRYNWDEGKGVTIGPLDIPDGQLAKLHRTGLARSSTWGQQWCQAIRSRLLAARRRPAAGS
ncbi:hypothetical protein GT045_03325 [Streptomyces sp. SID486]|uniref:hypothetical protein n=1 Tax=Streptomyces sp. SID486 TaxID=2690264 RepID=UPI001367A44C|nr:hypothetical protein [Streptomyces sp. SID486]MYX93866.1 hypothetical protein [Streptomyces sp. SID486]